MVFLCHKTKKKRTPKMPAMFIVDSNKKVLSKKWGKKKKLYFLLKLWHFPNGEIWFAKIWVILRYKFLHIASVILKKGRLFTFQKSSTVPEFRAGTQENHICGLLIAGCVRAGFWWCWPWIPVSFGMSEGLPRSTRRRCRGAVLVALQQPELLCKCC